MEKCLICGINIRQEDNDNMEDKLCLGCNIDAEDAAFEATLDLFKDEDE